MAVDVLLGLQWGDEGKGKVVDVLAPKYDLMDIKSFYTRYLQVYSVLTLPTLLVMDWCWM